MTTPYACQPVPSVSSTPPYPVDLVEKTKTFAQATLAIHRPLGPARKCGLYRRKYPLHARRAEVVAKWVGVHALDLLADQSLLQHADGRRRHGLLLPWR